MVYFENISTEVYINKEQPQGRWSERNHMQKFEVLKESLTKMCARGAVCYSAVWQIEISYGCQESVCESQGGKEPAEGKITTIGVGRGSSGS